MTWDIQVRSSGCIILHLVFCQARLLELPSILQAHIAFNLCCK